MSFELFSTCLGRTVWGLWAKPDAGPNQTRRRPAPHPTNQTCISQCQISLGAFEAWFTSNSQSKFWSATWGTSYWCSQLPCFTTPRPVLGGSPFRFYLVGVSRLMKLKWAEQNTGYSSNVILLLGCNTIMSFQKNLWTSSFHGPSGSERPQLRALGDVQPSKRYVSHFRISEVYKYCLVLNCFQR